MQYGLKALGFGFVLAAGLAVSACGGEDDGGEPGADGGTTSAGGSSAGSAGSGTGGTSANGGTGAGSSGGSSAGSGSGGPGGSNANGGTAGSLSAGAGGGGTSGGSSGGTGGSGGGEACTPASTDGIEFSGSCTSADLCSDQYDTSFGAETLEQLCTAQSGTWSTAHCNAADWDKKCTQDVFGGVYVQYMPSDGICALGCEEAL